MLITTKQKRNVLKSTSQNLELNIPGNELDIVQKTKYHGVQIDCSLDWKEQIKAVSAKVSRAIGFLKHAKKFLPGRGVLDLILYGDVPTKKILFTLLQNFCLQMIPCSRKRL